MKDFEKMLDPDQDNKNVWIDEYGAEYSLDRKRLLRVTENTLEKYYIKDGTEMICNHAFSYCDIGTIYIPASVSLIGYSIPGGIKRIIIDDNPYYDSRDNCNAIIETATNKLIFSTPSIVIPSSVTCIGRGAFSSCVREQFEIPYGVTCIEDCAFDDSTLSKIIIPDSVIIIGNFAFQGCRNITSIIIPDSVKVIGDKAFEGCYDLEFIELSNALEVIGHRAFGCCHSLKKIIIPKSVQIIGNGAFDACTRLTNLIFEGIVEKIGNINGWMEVGRYLDIYGDYLYGYELDWGYCEYGYDPPTEEELEIQWEKEFQRWRNLNVLIPFGAEVEYVRLFGKNCHFLRKDGEENNIAYPDVVTNIDTEKGIVYDSAFAYSNDYKSLLSSVDFEDKVYFIKEGTQTICDYAFSLCGSLKKVTIPSSVSFIGKGAFKGCNRLEEVIFKGSVPNMTSDPFDCCISLKQIIIPFGTIDDYSNILNHHTDILQEEEQNISYKKECKEHLQERGEGICSSFRDLKSPHVERAVNKTCITAVIEKNGYLERCDFSIPGYECLLGELQEIVNNRNKSLLDLQDFYFRNVKIKKKTYNYSMPNEYNTHHVIAIKEPEEITYSDFIEDLSREEENIRLDIEEKAPRKHWNQDEVEKKITMCLDDYKQKEKEELYIKYENVIRAYLLYMHTQIVKQKDNIKMWSTENIGFTKFSYPINNDTIVYVDTNFCYGASSYFDITVKYKEIIIIPYSYVVKYKYANIMEIRKCTRAYRAKRKNWDLAFDFVVDFVNKSLKDPKEFVINTIMNEVKEMVHGLKLIMQAPEQELKRMCKVDKSDENYEALRINELSSDHRYIIEIEKVYPSEFLTLFKVEKICGTLNFMDSLQRLITICPEIRSHIKEIEILNTNILPEILQVRDVVQTRKLKLQASIEELKNKIEVVEKEILPYKSELDGILRTINNENKRGELIEQYKKNHPKYSSLIDSKNSLNTKLRRSQNKHILCRRMIIDLTEFEKQNKNYFKGRDE